MSAWDRLNAPRRRRGDTPDVDGDGRAVTRFCDLCGDPLRVGQRRRHFTCCADQGGRPGDVCREITPRRPKGAIAVCSFCWVPADPSAGGQGEAA